MKPQTEVVATFNDLEKAQAVQTKLEQAGIAARVVDQSNFQKYMLLCKPLASARVLVDEADFKKARQLLQTADVEEHILSNEVHCLKCGSPHVDYPQFARKFLTTTVVGVLLALLHLIRKEFYCRNCHHTWPVADALRSRTDILNWPTDGGVVKKE